VTTTITDDGKTSTIISGYGTTITSPIYSINTTIFAGTFTQVEVSATGNLTTVVHNRLTPGPVIGIAIPVFLLGVLLAACLIPFILKRRKKKPEPQPGYGGGGTGGYGETPPAPPAGGYGGGQEAGGY
jgi:hypothetical protein